MSSLKVETLLSIRHWQIKDLSSRKSMKEKTPRWLMQLTRQFRLLMKCSNKRKSRFRQKMNKLKLLENKCHSRDKLIRKRSVNSESKHLVSDNPPSPRFIVSLQPKKPPQSCKIDQEIFKIFRRLIESSQMLKHKWILYEERLNKYKKRKSTLCPN